MGNLTECFNLIELKLNICISAKHRDFCFDFLLVLINTVDNAGEALKRTVLNPDAIADRKP